VPGRSALTLFLPGAARGRSDPEESAWYQCGSGSQRRRRRDFFRCGRKRHDC